LNHEIYEPHERSRFFVVFSGAKNFKLVGYTASLAPSEGERDKRVRGRRGKNDNSRIFF
jgi:hypothetical protein